MKTVTATRLISSDKGPDYFCYLDRISAFKNVIMITGMPKFAFTPLSGKEKYKIVINFKNTVFLHVKQCLGADLCLEM